MSDKGDKGKAAREAMAKLSGTDSAGYDPQLKTTRMFYTAKDAVADGATLGLLRVETEVVADVDAVTPHLGGGAFRYDPLPARLVPRRRRLRFVYFDGAGLRPFTFAAIRQAAREMGAPD